MNKKYIWVIVFLLISITVGIYLIGNLRTTPLTRNSSIPSISNECVQLYRKNNNYCKQFSKTDCINKSFSLPENQQIFCSWDEIESNCEAKPFCQ
jgi:hypothetical protein